MFIAFVFILVGLAFFLKNIGLIVGNIWGIIWPIILIAFGIYLALKAQRCKLFIDKIWKKFE